jgi:hypothetical protein
LWKLNESLGYYELALQLNPDLENTVLPIMDGLQKRKGMMPRERMGGVKTRYDSLWMWQRRWHQCFVTTSVH